jgi:hypothetical protein
VVVLKVPEELLFERLSLLSPRHARPVRRVPGAPHPARHGEPGSSGASPAGVLARGIAPTALL